MDIADPLYNQILLQKGQYPKHMTLMVTITISETHDADGYNHNILTQYSDGYNHHTVI